MDTKATTDLDSDFAYTIPTPLPSSATSSTATTEKRPVQCFIHQVITGSQELIRIEMPLRDLHVVFDRDSALPTSSCTARTMLTSVAAHESRRRVRFSQAKEGLLAQLKEQRESKLW